MVPICPSPGTCSSAASSSSKSGFDVAAMQAELNEMRTCEAHVRSQVGRGSEMEDSREGVRLSTDAATAAVGCGPIAICSALGKRVSRMLRLQASSTHANDSAVACAGTSAVASSAVACGANESSELGARIFGVGARTKRVAASEKLEQVSSAMLARAEDLRTRAEAQRQLALRTAQCSKPSSRSMAIAQLRRAKQLEKQADAAQCAHEAVEAQSDMLQQTALQREVAAAIGASTRSLKKDRALLTKAEGAVEAASEMRDLHDDIAQTMGELGSSSHTEYDDDELWLEVQQMSHDAPMPDERAAAPSSTSATTNGASVAAAAAATAFGAGDGAGASAESVAAAAAELRRRHAEYDEAERMRRAIPDAPATKMLRTEERSSLLSQA